MVHFKKEIIQVPYWHSQIPESSFAKRKFGLEVSFTGRSSFVENVFCGM